MITQNTWERLSLPITEYSEELVLYALNQLRVIQERLIRNQDVNERARLQNLQNRWQSYIEDAEAWMDEELAQSYLRGIERSNKLGGSLAAGAFVSTGLLIPNNPSQPISDRAAKILSDYPEHHTMYGVYRQKADDAFRATRLPILRQQQDRIRELTIRASDSAFREADTLTRRQLSQQIMNRYADDGVTGIVYSNGNKFGLDSYSEMTARTMTQQANNQAVWNRAQEYGNDLVQVSVHFPCSDICEQWQGRVYSLSGSSDQYPDLQTAIDGLLFRTNCRHSSSPYIPGLSELPDKRLTRTQNREQYMAEQEQRKNERYIRSWKRREAVSVSDEERARAKAKVKEWQGKQRSHIQENDYLRRKYEREQI